MKYPTSDDNNNGASDVTSINCFVQMVQPASNCPTIIKMKNKIFATSSKFFSYLMFFVLLNAITITTDAQYNVILGTHNVPITKVHLNRNGSAITQTSGNPTTIQTTDAIILDSLLVNDGGTKVLKYFNVGGAYITNNAFTSSVTGVGIYDEGAITLASNASAWEAQMADVVADENLLHYMYYDYVTNIPTGNDFDVLWARAMTSDDYFVVSERNGNTYFTVTALGSDGNVISGARQLRFGFTAGTTSSNGNNKYDWNIGFGSLGHIGHQPQYMSVVDINLFNTSQDVYGVRVDNNGEADVKFFGISENDMSNNPINPMIPGIIGNVFGDANGLNNSTVDGQLLDSAGNSLLHVSLVQGGVVVATVPVGADGQYCFLNIDAGTYTTVLHTTATGSTTASLPTNWVNTGENDGAGSGSDGTINGISPSVTVTDSLESQINFGIEQLPETDDFSFSLTTSPELNEIRDLVASDGMGGLTGSDSEDGAYGTGDEFVITDTTGLNGNVLFYDADGDGVLDAGEELYPNDTIANYDPSKLSVKFNGLNSMSFTFNYSWIDAAGLADATPATYAVNWTSPVPVNWLKFTATLIDVNNVRLEWSTATELNNSYFEVQRFQKATGEFVAVGIIDGAGTTNDIQYYSFIDNVNLTTSEKLIYRVKQVDFDGQFDYSEIAVVNRRLEPTIRIFPIPANNDITISIEGSYAIEQDEEGKYNSAQVEMVSLEGRIIESVKVQRGSKAVFNTMDLNTGVYFITVNMNGEVSTRKFLVKH